MIAQPLRRVLFRTVTNRVVYARTLDSGAVRWWVGSAIDSFLSGTWGTCWDEATAREQATKWANEHGGGVA